MRASSLGLFEEGLTSEARAGMESALEHLVRFLSSLQETADA
jgi:hypothetical protein